MRLLVITQDTMSHLRTALRNVGISPEVVDSPAAVQQGLANSPDAVLVDRLPDNSTTLRLVRLLSERATCPIMVRLVEASEDVRLSLLLLGADSVFPDGLDDEEIALRVGTRLSGIDIEGSRATIDVGEISIDLRRRSACVHDQEVELTKIEFDVFLRLCRSANQVVTREELVSVVWGDKWFGAPNLLDTHIGNVRNKLANAGQLAVIKTVRGVGFYVVAPQFAASR